MLINTIMDAKTDILSIYDNFLWSVGLWSLKCKLTAPTI